MAQKKQDKVSFQEALKLQLRAMRDLHGDSPQLFPAITVSAILTAVIPYVTVALSAQIIAELSGLRRPEVLWRWVAITVALGGVLALLKAVVGNWKRTRWHIFQIESEHMFVRKAFTMDYADMDNQAVRDLRSQIIQNTNFNGKGLYQLPHMYGNAVESVVGILSAVVLSYQLFTLPVPDAAGALTALNSPLFLLAFLGLMLGISALSSLCANKASSYYARLAAKGRLGNRLFGAFGFLTESKSRAVDVRMYQQQDLAQFYMKKDSAFAPGGLFDKLNRGPKGIFAGISAAVPAVFTGFAYLFTCLKAWGGAFGIGQVTQYVGAVTALSGNLSSFLALKGTLCGNAPFLADVYRYLDLPNSMYQGSLTTEKRADRQYEVEFKDVSFRYPGSDAWALRHVNMKFRVGRRLAVVGENGSGKTTFIKLLCRLYDPQEGAILLNGIDIRKYDYRDYMNIFSVVFQDFQLIAQPVGANVAGAADYDRDRAEKALVDAGFGERLKSMPKGLDTYLYKELDKEGVEVSGGEAQKIAIARALYKDAPFIILDEPTAALDPLAEAEIYAKFDQIAGDRTAVYISHRLSSCKFCDEIAVFDHGAVIQQGSHEGLLADEDGKYHELWHAQAQYYAKTDSGE